MLIIADSGATKTDWCLLSSKGEFKTVQTGGLNPYFLTGKEMLTVLEKDLDPYLNNEAIDKVYFYGSGCGESANKQMLQSVLEDFFKTTDIEIDTDMFGAALSLFPNQTGIACILGTGSNACLFDGQRIIQKTPSLGFILGDEGSGACIGKYFISKYLNEELPDDLQSHFQKKYAYSSAEILDSIYRRPFPNVFLASFVSFMKEHEEHEFIREIIRKAFDDFFVQRILLLENHRILPLGFIGSIAYCFKDILLEIAQTYHLNITKVEKSPISGLLDFYQSQQPCR